MSKSYTVAGDGAQFTNPSPSLAQGVLPGSVEGVAITGYMCSVADSGALLGIRNTLARLSGGTPLNKTAEQDNTRSSAADAIGKVNDGNAQSTVIGNPLVILSTYIVSAGTAVLSRQWTIPNARYPIYQEPSAGLIGVQNSTSGSVPVDGALFFSQPFLGPFERRSYGRRSTKPGYYPISTNGVGGFNGVSTGPKVAQYPNAPINYIVVADWPSSPTPDAQNFLLNLNGGPVVGSRVPYMGNPGLGFGMGF